MTFYKIRNLETGLYSTGGSSPRWSRMGKVWRDKRALSLHLSQFRGPYGYPLPYKSRTIVVVEYQTEPTTETPVVEVMEAA